MEIVLAPKLQPLSHIDFQITDELMHHNCVPLSFGSFQFLKKNATNIPEARTGKPIENQELSLKPMQQTFQFLQDPIADALDDLCKKCYVSFTSYGLKSSYAIDMIRQSTSFSSSAGASFQKSS